MDDDGFQALLVAYASLRLPGHTPKGLYAALLPDDMQRWQFLLFLHKGPYAGAIFQGLITWRAWPARLPTVVFLGKVWHPLVNHQGVLNLEAAIRLMQPSRQTRSSSADAIDTAVVLADPSEPTASVTAILFAIKACFKSALLDRITVGDARDPDALSAWRAPDGLFARIAGQCAQASTSKAVMFAEDRAELPIRLSDPNTAGLSVQEGNGAHGSYEEMMTGIETYMEAARQ